MRAARLLLTLHLVLPGCKEATKGTCTGSELNQLQETCLSYGGSFAGEGESAGSTACAAEGEGDALGGAGAAECTIEGSGSCSAICSFGDPEDGAPETDSETDPGEDRDGDGWAAEAGDCNDSDDSVYPGAPEYCDGIQNDCEDADWDSDRGIISFADSDLNRKTLDTGNQVTHTLAESGTLSVCPGTSDVTLDISADVVITNPLADVDSAILHGTAGTPVVSVSGQDVTVTLSAVEIQGGGGVSCTEAELLLSDVVVSGNTAEEGGGLSAEDCTIIIDGGSFVDNSATRGGAVALSGGELSASGVEFIGNSATYGGAVWLSRSAAELGSAAFSSNEAHSGGAVYASGGSLTSGGEFTGNSATENGGAIFAERGAAVTLTAAAVFSGNTASNGRSGSGGALHLDSSSATVGAELLLNEADYGGAIFTTGVKHPALDLTASSVLSLNTASFSGGAVYLEYSSADVAGTMSNNVAAYGGAVFLVGGTVATNEAFFSGNSAESGGAIMLYAVDFTTASTLESTDSTFSGNTATDSGGALHLGALTGAEVYTSSFSNNSPSDGYTSPDRVEHDWSTSASFSIFCGLDGC